MLRNLFSSRTSGLSIEEALELANKRLELACKEDVAEKALGLCDDAKLLLKDAENIFSSKKVKDPALSEGIANTYHEHGRLLDELGYHDKARKSHSKAEKWGYAHEVSRHPGSSQPVGKRGSIRRSWSPIAALSDVRSITAATRRGSLRSGSDVTQLIHLNRTHVSPVKVDSDEPTPHKGVVQISQKIFERNITPPVAKYTLPDAGARITSTLQLAYCLSLLHPSMISKEALDQSERDWLQAKAVDPDEQGRLQTMATDLVRAFVQEGYKRPNIVAEVISLAAVLEKDDSRKLLQVFADGINQSVFLDVHLLSGLAHLIRNAIQGYIDDDDLVKILELLSARLKDTHAQSTQHTYQLAVAISQVLDSMVDSQIEGLSREQLHEPLSDYFKGLQQNSDPYLTYQAAYAYQALLYIPNDETILQSMMRRTGKAVQGISGIVSAVKALDLVGFVEGLQSIQQGLTGAGKAIELVTDAYSNAVALTESGQGLLESLKESFNSNRKRSWYPALRGLDRLVQEGRFADFEKLVREAPCRHDPAFRWGVYQRLGEIAANIVWDLNTRKCAVDFLRQEYVNDANKDQQVNTLQWILYIFNQLAESYKDIIDGPVQELLLETQASSSSGKETPYRGYDNDNLRLHPIVVTPRLTEFPLLDSVQNKPDVEAPLRQLKRERLKDRGGDVYISPRAKATSRATDHFDLNTKVQEFLASDRKVFLLLGDSGAGKSTFNRALEINLWDNYDKTNGRIPLFIYLPAIEKPERELIAERLRQANFTESQILELKLYREFILICDGYDETQQTRNLYMSNQFNQPGQWRAQMVVSCRAEYTGVDYKDCFQPIDRNSGKDTGQYQEAIISPFTEEQIQDYIGQYVSLRKSSWGIEDYLKALKRIPNLQDLVKNPFLLKLSLEVLPHLSRFSSTHITRVQLYDEFVAQWIDRGKIRLREMELNPHDKETFKRMADSGFQQHGITYLKELVTAIYEHQNGNPVVYYSEHHDRRTWKEAFFSEKDGRHLLREVIPLTRNGDQYRFIHKSLLEYGLTLAIYEPSKRNEETEEKPPMSRRGSTSSVLSFECLPSTERKTTADEQSLLNSPLGKRNLVGEPYILRFLTERVREEPVFRDQLHAVIERSKYDKTVRIAAANAITILIRAGFRFNSADLRNIKIPGADLSFGMFDSAQLEGADLRKVNLRNVWMRQANLRGAQMKGAQFGELPFLQEDDRVMCCAYSPDGKTYAAGLYNGNISLYKTSSWDRTQTLKGHGGCINSVSFSATGDRVVSGSLDSTVRLWDVHTGKCVYVLQGHRGQVMTVACSPKGDRIASGSRDNTVRLWDIDIGKCVHTLQGHSSWVFSLVYSSEGDRIASSSDDRTVRLWDADTGKCIYVLEYHNAIVRTVTYSPKGNQIASGSDDKTIRLWDVDTGECAHTLEGHSGWIRSLSYSPKGDRVASTSDDKTVQLWNAQTGERIYIMKGHGDVIPTVMYSPKGDRIASGSHDKTVRLWDVDTGECIQTLQGHSNYVVIVAYSPKGDHVASGSYDKTVRLWDVDTGECISTFQSHTGWVRSVMYSPNGDQIASGADDATVRLWDVETGECTHTLQGHSRGVGTVVYSPEGDRIATGSDDSILRLWDVDAGEFLHTLRGHDRDIKIVAYSPKGDQVATGSYDNTVRLWDVNTGECIRILQGHSWAVRGVAYSPKGDQIASGSYDKTIRLWDVETGECVNAFQGHDHWVRCVVYSPKGGQLASGSDDSTVRLWDLDTGECIHTLQGHSRFVSSVAYSPKGDHVASGGDDRTVRLWDVETGQCLTIISGFSNCVGSIAFENNFSSLYLVTGSWDKSIRRWRIIKERDGHKAVLCWSSSHEVLTICGLSFEDVQDLSGSNQRLLIQRGALVPKSMSFGQEY